MAVALSKRHLCARDAQLHIDSCSLEPGRAASDEKSRLHGEPLRGRSPLCQGRSDRGAVPTQRRRRSTMRSARRLCTQTPARPSLSQPDFSAPRGFEGRACSWRRSTMPSTIQRLRLSSDGTPRTKARSTTHGTSCDAKSSPKVHASLVDDLKDTIFRGRTTPLCGRARSSGGCA